LVSVKIDGITCAVTAVTATAITCTSGNKGATNTNPTSLDVKVSGSNALVKDGVVFYYGLIYSNILSWGGESYPRDGDSIYVPKGRTLIVD